MNTNISELFEKIQDNFITDELNGEFLLEGKIIIWSYNLISNSEDIEYEDDEENMFCFETESSEELLLNGYQEDFDKLNIFLDEIEEYDWNISESEIQCNLISFNIY